MSDLGNWCLIESDPGVFSELIKGFGAEGLECEEVYDLKEIDRVSDALGFVFLFKWGKQTDNDGAIVKNEQTRNVFFAKQLIMNACATQALINILLNIEDGSIDLGTTLKEFKSFVSEFDSSMKGAALSNSEKIRAVHNSFSNYQIFEFDRKNASKDDDVYHFVSYVPINGVVYELDGLKEGPIEHNKILDGQNWVETVKPILEKRMQKCMDGNFNLMAVVPHRLTMYQKQLEELKNQSPASALVTEIEKNIETEKQKATSYKAENIRRRHNYLPLIVELLKILGENNRLSEMVRQAKAVALERQTHHQLTSDKK